MQDGPKIAFVQFWTTSEPEDNPYWDFFRERYGLRVSSDPDFIFASIFGGGIERYAEDCVRIGIIYENVRPDFNVFDYALGFDYLQFEDRYLRLPLWVRAWKSIGLPDRSDERLFDREFCSLVNGNKQMGERIEFMDRLSEYRAVASGGSVANNVGYDIGPGQQNKIAFCRNYKFNIAFENSSTNGYTTEKIGRAHV